MTQSQINATYLDMIGKHYHFSYAQPKPYHKDPGYCRVVGVALHEHGNPELEILAAGDTDPEYYSVDELTFNMSACEQGNSAIFISNTV